VPSFVGGKSAFKKEEVSHFLNNCREYRPDFHPFFMTAFRTGMRLGELLALKWDDVDWHGKFIRVNKSFRRGQFAPTKTGKIRRVDMSDQLLALLHSKHVERKKEALKSGIGVIPCIFHERGGTMPVSQNYVRQVFWGVLKKAGLRRIRIHDIRHTFASLLLTDGASLVYVKEQLGHSSIQMTVDIYGHLIPSANRDAVNRLDEEGQPATQPQQKRHNPLQVMPLQPYGAEAGTRTPTGILPLDPECIAALNLMKID